MFRNLGIKVNLVNTREKLLEFLDDEIIDALSYHMRDQGILIRHNEAFERIEGLDDGVVLYLESGKQLKTDIILWANGRSGNTEDMGLETIGVMPSPRGHPAREREFPNPVRKHLRSGGRDWVSIAGKCRLHARPRGRATFDGLHR